MTDITQNQDTTTTAPTTQQATWGKYGSKEDYDNAILEALDFGMSGSVPPEAVKNRVLKVMEREQ